MQSNSISPQIDAALEPPTLEDAEPTQGSRQETRIKFSLRVGISQSVEICVTNVTQVQKVINNLRQGIEGNNNTAGRSGYILWTTLFYDFVTTVVSTSCEEFVSKSYENLNKK